MKLTPSLRIFVLLVMLFTGISTILILSMLSVHYFISGMDQILQSTMYAQAQDQQVIDGQPKTSHFFTVASRWQDLPKRSNKILSLSLASLTSCIKTLLAARPLRPL